MALPASEAVWGIWAAPVILGAILLGGGAFGLWGGWGHPAMAAIALSSGSALVMLALWQGVQTLRASREDADIRGAIARMGQCDPDLCVLSDLRGRILHPESLTGIGLAALFDPWTVDAASRIEAVIAEVQDLGFARRRFERVGGALDLTAFRAAPTEGLLLWRLSERIEPRRMPDPVAHLPTLRFRGDQVSLNVAAHDCIAQSPALLAALGAIDRRPGAGARVQMVPRAEGGERSVLVCPSAGDDVAMVLLPGTVADIDRDAPHPIDMVPVALLLIDRTGRIGRANATARKLLGLEPGEAPELWRVLEDLGRPVSDWLDDAWAGRALGRPEVVRIAQGATETFIQIVLHRSGHEDNLLAILTDATELKSLEARFAQSQKMQAVGQLAGGIAHDFNNLLTAIAGHCDLLLHDRDRFDPAYGDLIQIHQNANRAAALVRQLLAFSRKQKMKKEPVDLERLLEHLMHLLARLVGEKIRIALRHDPDLAVFMADPRQLEQVIMNLVVNARDAMPMGGTIRIETRAIAFDAPHRVGRAQLPAGRYALLRVIDSGLGIRAELLDKIFEPFFTTKKLGEGTGLGLSTVYGIVKQMGGYVFVESVEGAGTTFSLYFSADAEIVASPMPLPDPAMQRTGAASALGQGVPLVPHPVEIAARLETQPVQAGRRADTGARASFAPALQRPGPAIARPASAATTTAIATATATAVVPRPGPAAADTRLRVGRSSERAPTTILLAEDEAPVRAFAARALRLKGFEVIEATDGEQALGLLSDRAVHVDLFITDVIMPTMDGPAWVSRALDDRPGTPVVFMSGYAEDAVNEALSRIPDSTFLSKPFSLDELTQMAAAQARVPA